MASISTDQAGGRRIQFQNGDGKRKAVRLGNVALRKCEEWVRHIEQMLEANRFGQTVDHATVAWSEALPDELHEKLVVAGLVSTRDIQVCTLRAFLDGYILGRKDVKPATKIVWNQVADSLTGYFGDDRKLTSVTEGEASAFKQHLIGTGLASTTVHKRLQFARMLFKQAVKHRIIARNPFAEVSASAVIPAEQKFFVERVTIEKLMPFCDTTWRTIVALGRFGGLRTPSETLSLRWTDIDREKGRVCVQSPKTEHHLNGANRAMPLFPELRKYLEEAKAKAPSNAVYVVDERYRKPAMTANGWANANLRTQLLRLLKKAGIEPWPRLFHNLRATRETELVAQFPIHVVAHWLGNTPDIAMRHYLLVTERDFARAACNDQEPTNARTGGAESGAVLAQNEAQHTSAPICTESQLLSQTLTQLEVMQADAISCDPMLTPLMEEVGSDNPRKKQGICTKKGRQRCRQRCVKRTKIESTLATLW